MSHNLYDRREQEGLFAHRIIQDIRFGYALPFGTLLPTVAMLYMLEMLYEMPINNIYKTGELGKKSTCSILEQVAAD
ncbi:hypothetical protein KAW48_01680, partial [candidate division WOR-3 bacterium]|nr:hypothetical protein [candidate division WOR-3 bacterium]